MVDRDHTSLASGSIGAVLGPVIGEPLKGAIAALILPAWHFVKNGWELKSITADVNASDCFRFWPEVANRMKDFHPSSDEYIMLSKFINDSKELMLANIDGRQNYTLYNRGLKSRKILACKERVEADLVAVRALVEDKHSHYLVPTLDVRKPIVPRESHISDLKSLLADEHEPEWILIHGKSGVGKTHLVRYVFQMQEVRQLFGCIAYLEVGRDTDEVSMVMDICSQLRMLPRHSKITNVGEGMQSIQTFANRTSDKMTLIVLENVCNPDILRAVDIKGVRKLVTSQRANVLDQFSMNRIAKLEVNPLSYRDAHTLFCLHAFAEDEAPEDIRDHVELMVKQCYGVPKVLEVMARYMSKDFGDLYSPTYWEHVLEKIRRGKCDEHEKIFRVLKLSYDDLSNDEKVLFLCSVMHDRHLYSLDSGTSTDPLYYWWLVLGSYEYDDYQHREFLCAWKSLEDASLADKYRYPSKLMVELAEHIIKTDKHPYFTLRSCSGRRTSGVEVIYGDMGDMKGEKVSDILSNEMPRLSVLQLRLREPMHISLESFSNLKFLCLSGHFVTICGLELLVQLRYLELTPYQRCWCSYENLLEGLGRLHQLEVLQIHCDGECDGGAHLDFRFLKNMDRLNCLHITSMRIHPVRNLQHIEELNHFQVLRLTSGPLDLNYPTFNSSLEQVSLGNHEQQQQEDFCLIEAETVEVDPQKFAWLLNGTQKLRILELFTVRFKEVPLEINFPSLVSLQLNIASKYLPNGLESLHHLQRLTLNGGGTLLELPSINKLPNLQWLALSGFSGKHFPESFCEPGAFPSLMDLIISNCQQLEILAFQQGSAHLHISDCKSLSQLDFIEQIHNDISILRCNHLKGLSPYFTCLNVRMLYLNSLPSLVWEGVNPVGFPRLECLIIKSFTFKHLPPIITLLTGLKWLDIYDCPQLEALLEDHTQFFSLVNLEEMKLRNLLKLIYLPDSIETLPFLNIIKMYNCPGIGTVNGKDRVLVRKEGKLIAQE